MIFTNLFALIETEVERDLQTHARFIGVKLHIARKGIIVPREINSFQKNLLEIRHTFICTNDTGRLNIKVGILITQRIAV